MAFHPFHTPAFPWLVSWGQFVRLELFIAPLNLKPVPTWSNALKSRIQLLTVCGVNYKLPVNLTFDLLVTSAVSGSAGWVSRYVACLSKALLHLFPDFPVFEL
jgi:hypothetical protein